MKEWCMKYPGYLVTIIFILSWLIGSGISEITGHTTDFIHIEMAK